MNTDVEADYVVVVTIQFFSYFTVRRRRRRRRRRRWRSNGREWWMKGRKYCEYKVNGGEEEGEKARKHGGVGNR